MNTAERVNAKRKALRRDLVIRWAQGIGIGLIALILSGFVESM